MTRQNSRILWTFLVIVLCICAYAWMPTWVFWTASIVSFLGLAVMWLAAGVEDRRWE